MDVFREIRAQLHVFRGLLRRREALRTLAFILAGLLALALVTPYLAAAASDRAVAPLRTGFSVAVALAALTALLLGVIRPSRRLRRDGDVARLVGAASPGIASDLLSTVELEAEVRGAPRFSTELAVALAEDIRLRLDLVDPERVAPAAPVRRAAWSLAAVALLYVGCAVLAPARLRAGWERLANPPAPPSLSDRAAPVAEPLVGDIGLVLTYPEYTRRAPLVAPAATGDLVAPRGTKVSLETTALRPAAAARLLFVGDDGKETQLPLALEGRTVRGGFTVDKPVRFRFVLAPAEGRPLVESEPHRVEVEADRAPRVELIAPADELDVSSRRRVELAYTVDDDYGIAEIALVWRGAGKEERKVLAAPPPGARSAQAKIVWDLNEITMGPGTRIAYHIEVKDNDNVGGPNVGSSKTLYLRIFSPRERHEEVMAKQAEVFEEAVRALAARLELGEAPASEHRDDELDAHHVAATEMEKLVADVAALLGMIGADTLAPRGLKEEVEGIHTRLEKLARDEQTTVSEWEMKRLRTPGMAVPRGVFVDHDRRAGAELERDVLALDDWMSRQRLEELLAISDELKQHRAKLKDLMAQYERSQTPELRAEIEREMRAIEQRIAELEAKAAQLNSEVADRFVNNEAMDGDESRNCFGKVRELLDKGDVIAAQKQLELCSKQAEDQAKALEEGLRGLRGDRFSEEEKAYGELQSEIAGLEDAQRNVARAADDLLDRYKERAAQELRERSSPQQAKARQTLGELAREVAGVPREGLTPFAQDELDALKKRLTDVDQMLDEGDVAEALSMARHAQSELETIGSDIEDDLEDGRPTSGKTDQAEEQVNRAVPLAQQLVDELGQATPSPQEMMSPEDRQKMAELRRKQKELRDKTAKLGQKAQKSGGQLPGQVGEQAGKGLEEAAEQMGRAEQRMNAPDPMGARDEAQGAAEKLSELQGKMQRSARPSSVPQGEGGRRVDDDTVKIPGSDDYKPPEAFREDILDAMKKDKPPEAYKDQVKRYYEELVK